MFRLVTAPLSVRLLSNTVTKPKPYFLNVRLSNSDSNKTATDKSHENAFMVTLDTNGDGFISRKELVEDFPKRFAAAVGPPQETVDRLRSLLSNLAKVSQKLIAQYAVNLLLQGLGLTEGRQISCDEFAAAGRAAAQNTEVVKLTADIANCIFDGLDSNGDGYIDPSEWVKLMKFMNFDPKEAEAAFKAIDKNGDGLISRDEYRSLHVEYWTSDEPTLGSDKMFGNREPLNPTGHN